MSKHHKHRSGQPQESFGRQQQAITGTALQQREGLQKSSYESPTFNMTPGRAPAEGGDEPFPSHERWEQDTYDRAPAEGADYVESVIPPERRSRKR